MKKVGIFVVLVLFAFTAYFGYTKWKPSTDNNCEQQFLSFYNELKAMYDQAVKDQAGSPDFLADLEKLLEKYNPFLAEKPISYWIQDDKNIWIKGTWNGTKTLYVYYSPITNGDPRKEWENGDKVFDFFDDFNGSEINRSKWPELATKGDPDITVKMMNGEISLSTNKAHSYFCFGTPINSFPFRVITKEESSGGNDGIYFQLGAKNPFNSSESNPVLTVGWAYPGYKNTNGSCLAIYDGNNSKIVGTNIPFNTNNATLIELDVTNNTAVLIYNDDKTTIHDANMKMMNKLWIGDSYGDWGPGFITIDYIFVTKYTSTPPSIKYAPEETGVWNVDGYTFTKRRKVIVYSTKLLNNFQINLDFSKFNNEMLLVTLNE